MASMIAMSKIVAGKNVRLFEVDDFVQTPLSDFPKDKAERILALAETIREHGLLSPIVVKDLGGGKKFRIIAGHRRFKAMQHLGKTTIDAKSIKGPVENEMTLSIIENVQREDLNAMEVAFGLEELMKLKHITKQSSLASLVQKSKGWVSQHMALLKADSNIQNEIRAGSLGLSAARALASLPPSEQAEALSEAKKESKAAGKPKVTTKSARRQVTKSTEKKKNAQKTLEPIAVREREQRDDCIRRFVEGKWGEEKPPQETVPLCRIFWKFLLDETRLIIKP